MLHSPYISLTCGHTYPQYLNQHTLLMERTCFLSSLCVALFMVQSYIASLAFATVPNITMDQSTLLALKVKIFYDPQNVLTNS
jgi:hypothetical protein